MKNTFHYAVLLACCLASASCSSGGGLAAGTDSEGSQGQAVERSVSTNTQEYSSNTLILSLEEGVSDADVYALAERYGMDVLYLYENFNMCALKLPESLSDRQFEQLIARLEKEPGVLQAMRDGIMHLD